jgi:recombinational DNA repair protein (RecF pathway)
MIEDCKRCKRRIRPTDQYYIRRYGVCEKCVRAMGNGK